MDLNYYSIRELLDSAKKEGLPLSSLVLTQQAEQLELTEEEVYNKMRENYLVMRASIEPGCDPDLRSTRSEERRVGKEC